MTPAKLRSGAQGLLIRYTITDYCPLGWLLVAATDKGVCTIAFDDNPDEQLVCLKRRFKHAEFRQDRTELHRWVDAITGYFWGAEPRLRAPIRYPRYRVSAARMERASGYPCRGHRELRGESESHWKTYGSPSRSTSMRRQSGAPRYPMSPCRACEWRTGWLSVGRHA